MLLRDYTREGHKEQYYVSSKSGNFAYSHKDDMKEWEEIEEVYNVEFKSGEILDLEEYTLIPWEIEGANIKEC